MNSIIDKLFSDYLEGQKVVAQVEYAHLAAKAVQQEKALREMLGEAQTQCFEELFELTSEIHFLEVKDAFFSACKLGAKASRDLII